MARALETIATTEDAGRDRPARGPAWLAAVQQGIDVTLLEHRLRLPPYLRLREHLDHMRFGATVRRRTVSPGVESALARQRLDEKLASLGLRPDQVLEPVDDDQH
jgi:hypothetical protein